MKNYMVRYIFSERCVPKDFGMDRMLDVFLNSLEECKRHKLCSNIKTNKPYIKDMYYRTSEESYWIKL